ncbi:MAG: Gfo/Idh/MocA family oxidoreductase [Micropepsaceae bacterium]
MSLSYAMIGGGPGAMIGEVHRLAARASGWKLVAGAFSSDPAKSQAQAVKAGLDASRGYGDWQSLIANSAKLGLDAVVIVKPNFLHAEQAAAALKAGLHVICDKPLCTNGEDARHLAALTGDRVFGLTYAYSGYAALQRAAALVAGGHLGTLRLVTGEFTQDWLALDAEKGASMAAWRTDPARSGPSGAVADIGTHLFHMSSFVTGGHPEAVSADLTAMVAGRRLEDTALVRMRYANGARGQITISQSVACSGGGIRFAAMGDEGGVAWAQETPHVLKLMRRGAAAEFLDVPTTGPLPDVPGAPSGFLNSFAAVYGQFDAAMKGGSGPYPGIADGVRGVAFIEAAVASSRRDGAWVTL